jgi:predicted O-linked N-acetylglucosamine transferase (SPINDLY family)
LPARQNGFITFGSANRGFKLDNAQLRLWAEIVSRSPQSRFHFKGLHCSDPNFVSRAKTVFVEKGILPERLVFETFSPHPEFLEFYRKIDISLDTSPYNGTITTLESLWMGVPVITRTGRTFVSRVTGSFLHCLNKAAWVADSHEDYIQKSCAVASNIDLLEIDRRTLRDRLEMSTLCDGFKFTRQLETLFLKMLENGGRANVAVEDPSVESSTRQKRSKYQSAGIPGG